MGVQVRLWKVERSHDDILRYMRRTGGSLDNHADLIAYWKFDEPDGWATCNLPSLGLPLLQLQCFCSGSAHVLQAANGEY